MKLWMNESIHLDEKEHQQLSDSGYQLTEDGLEAEVMVDPEEISFSQYNHLKFVQILSAGYDQYDLESLQKHQVLFANARGVYSIPIAETIIGKLLSIFKEDERFRNQQKQRKWIRTDDLLELTDCRAVLYGTGDIAAETVKRLNAFGVFCHGVNTSGHDEPGYVRCLSLADSEQLLPQMDIVINTLPLNEQTMNYFNESRFALMKKTAVFVNIGRGKSVVEQDLLHSLDESENGPKWAVLDVFEKEPLAENSSLWLHDRVIVTPHVSGHSNCIETRRKQLIMTNLSRYAAGEALINRIL